MGDILSQDDLDALLGDLFPPKTEERRTPSFGISETEIETSQAPSETLSQDDIDRLLAEFGK
jgi:flagellar motor switch protein FliM